MDNVSSQNTQNAQKQTENYNGPVFEPKPGWGKRLKNWLKQNPTRTAAIIIAIIAIIALLTGNGSPQVVKLDKDKDDAKSANITASLENGLIKEIVRPGDGYALLARRAIKEYGARHPLPELGRAEKMFLEDGLSRTIQGQTLQVGNVVILNVSDIEQLKDKYQKLSPYQIRVWDWYARKAGLQ